MERRMVVGWHNNSKKYLGMPNNLLVIFEK